MGNKVDMAEVIAFSDELKSATSKIKSQLNAIKKSANQIAAMDSFTGLTADSAKDYLKDFHIKITENFTTLFESLSTQLSSHIVSFQSEVDSSNIAFLDSDFLKDEKTKLSDQYSKVSESHSNLKATIQKISDISSLKPPSLSEAAKGKKTAVQILQKTEDKLHNFTTKGKKDAAKMDELLDQLEAILKDVGKMDKGNRFSEYYNGTANKHLKQLQTDISYYKKGKTIVTGLITSYAMFRACKNIGLRIEVVDEKRGLYRVYATREALKHLGIKPNANAERAFNYRLPKNGKKMNAKHLKRAKTNVVLLKAANKKNGSTWTSLGEEAVKKHSAIQYWNDKATRIQKVKTVGKAALKGASDSLNVANDLKEIIKSGSVVKSAGKALGPIGTGLNYYSNYHDAKSDGLSGVKASARATADTAVDLAVGGAVQAASVAFFTAFIPIPGVGTAIGVGLGLALNLILNYRSKDNYNRKKKSSIMDKLKSWYH
ncbi:T7SS effector LXG polymorphic toxin [Heyndrickxia coagulans]|uniref:T7SS effector LXG polymorphic toxin n=1 Tax=Heyndrickxia coagulans TaxID=1398 RepID=UPI001A951709|nr:T7SS effector LXG polymorphic toxin [Heyndrickxia coagulans]